MESVPIKTLEFYRSVSPCPPRRLPKKLYLRKYAKPITFNTKTPEKQIFSQLAVFLKTKPSLSIFTYAEKVQVNKGVRVNNRNYSEEVSSGRCTPFIRQASPMRYRNNLYKRVKPDIKKLRNDSGSMEIEGKTCNSCYGIANSLSPEPRLAKAYEKNSLFW